MDDTKLINGQIHKNSPEVQKLQETLIQGISENILSKEKWSGADFHFGPVVGHGKFGKVFLAKEKKSEFLVAVKVFQRSVLSKRSLLKQIENEIIIHSQLKHPNIIPFYAYFESELSMHIVMEFAANGSLHELRSSYKYKRLPEYLTAKYVCQIAHALKYCHDLNFIHRDVKPENVLVDVRGNAKLADFGWSTEKTTSLKEYCGTMDYIAPEMLSNKSYNHSLDVWCLGVMCFELLVGRSPFHSKRRSVMFEKISSANIIYPKIVTLMAKDLIHRLVQRFPTKRLRLEKVINHPWVTEYYKAQGL